MPAGFTRIFLNGNPYDIPEESASPEWGEQLNQYLVDLNTYVSGLAGTFDILNRLQVFASAPTAYTNLNNVSIDPTVLTGGILSYSCTVTTSAVTGVELGQAYIVYNPNNAASSKFEVAKQHVDNANLNFYVTDLGQVQVQINPSPSGTFETMRLRLNFKAFEI